MVHVKDYTDNSIVQSYLAAYRQANPQDPQPEVKHEGGVFHVYGAAGQAFYRLDQLADARDRLMARAEAARTTH